MTAVPRAVCIAPRWLGDAILSRGAVALLAQAGIEVTVLVASGLARVYDDLPGVVRVQAVTSGSRWARLAAAWSLRRERLDAALVLPPSWTAAWASWLTRAGCRIGARTEGRDFLLTHSLPLPPRSLHLALHYAALSEHLCTAIGIRAATPPHASEPPLLHAHHDEILAGAARLASVGIGADVAPLVVAPGARYGPAKQYPPERFAAAVQGIQARMGPRPVVVVGEAGDRIAADAVRRALPECTDLVGRTDLAALIGILASAEGVLANDSGTMHLAAALGARVVGVFGSTNPEWTRPIGPRASIVHEPVWCSPCYAPTCAQDFACMLRLAPERIAAAFVALPATKPDATARPL